MNEPLDDITGYERVSFLNDKETGYHGVIAVHDTALGPAVGGTRHWRYDSNADAVRDVLRLAKAMTYTSVQLRGCHWEEERA